MRVLLVHNYFQFRGGEDDYVDNIHKLLIKKGHTVYLYSKNSKDLMNLKIKIISGIGLLTSTNREINKIISNFCPDICHIHNVFPRINFSIINICNQQHIPIVQTIHDYRYLCINSAFYRNNNACLLCINKGRLQGVIHKCYRSSLIASLLLTASIELNLHTIHKIDGFIFPNFFSRKLFQNKLNILPNQSVVIPHYVPKTYFKKTTVKKNDFIYVGRLSVEKGILDVIKVFVDNPKYTLTIIGNGPLAKYVGSLKKKNLIYRGFVSNGEKYNLIQKSRFSIIPSRVEEQGPLTLLESFMCGTPVIAPALSSIVEKVNNKSGILYNPHDEKNIALAIEKASKIARKQYLLMQHFVLDKFQTNYTEDAHYASLISAYNNIITIKKQTSLV